MADKKTATTKKRRPASKKKTTKKKVAKKTPAKMGRKRKFDDEKYEKLKRLMANYPSLVDAAWFFDCGKTTLEDEIRLRDDMTFREFRDLHMSDTRLKLVQTAIKRGLGGSDRMLMFSLTNLCDWKHKKETEHKGEVKASVSEDGFQKVMSDPKKAAQALKIAELMAAEDSDE